MPPPPFVLDLLVLRTSKDFPDGVPNVADSSSAQSVAIAAEVMRQLDLSAIVNRRGQTEGTLLEEGVREFLAAELSLEDSTSDWMVDRGQKIEQFAQYAHLAELDDLIENDDTGTLSVAIGRDYNVKPDVTIGIPIDGSLPHLHAAVSCKLTVRSDRVQNIRHEGVILTRHRRGRQPHIVAVTSEPLPTRLAGIGRGTGEIDALYHVALGALQSAVAAAGNDEQQRVLKELINQRRLMDLLDLPGHLLL